MIDETQPQPERAGVSDVATATALQPVGVVAIGRNEGDRLRQCLESVAGRAGAVVYVDSGSTDGSADLAKSLGAEVVSLDMDQPFTAARARNEGFARLSQRLPDLVYVQMVDGDCAVHPGWLDTAVAALDGDEQLAVVCGRRRERYPSASIYNGLTDMEWDTPVGEARSCGGDAMFRANALRQVGGYDPSVIAGEEPELCVRLRAAGHRVERLDAEMTVHDANMHTFGQWWKRNVRAGHAYAQGAAMHGATDGHNVKQVKSIVFWGVAAPVAIVLCTLLSAVFWPFGLLALGLCCGYGWLGWKVWRYRMKAHGDAAKEAAIYALFTVVGKLPNAWGAWTYWKNHALGRQAGIMEYKGAGAGAVADR